MIAVAGNHLPREHAEAALIALRRALGESGGSFSEGLGEGVRRLVQLRDELIERRRDGRKEPAGWLERCNAILSSVIAAEFPIQGVHRERIETACAALGDLLAR